MPPLASNDRHQQSDGSSSSRGGGGGGGGGLMTLSNRLVPADPMINPDLERFMIEGSVGRSIKCVLVGDGAIGKTSAVVSYTTNHYPTEYVPTAFDNYNVMVTVDNQPIRLQLCDTAGQDDFDSLRPLCYPGTDVFVLCFSVVSPTSFANVRDKWVPEIWHHCGRNRVPIVLVGTQCDLRSNIKVLIELASYGERPVPEQDAVRLATQLGAVAYLESSALTQQNLKEVFDTAILVSLRGQKQQRTQEQQPQQRQKSQKRCKASVVRYFKVPKRHFEISLCHRRPNSDTSGANGACTPKKRGWRKLCCCS